MLCYRAGTPDASKRVDRGEATHPVVGRWRVGPVWPDVERSLARLLGLVSSLSMHVDIEERLLISLFTKKKVGKGGDVSVRVDSEEEAAAGEITHPTKPTIFSGKKRTFGRAATAMACGAQRKHLAYHMAMANAAAVCPYVPGPASAEILGAACAGGC